MNRSFINEKTGTVFEEGEIMKREQLAVTLEKLANSNDPVQLFYNGEIADEILRDMKTYGVIVEDCYMFVCL